MQRQPTLSELNLFDQLICVYRESICGSTVTRVAVTSGGEAVTSPRRLDVTLVESAGSPRARQFIDT
jgi:hypothetical protein